MAQMNLSTEQKQTMDIENRLVVAKGVWAGSGMGGEYEVNRCKLVHLQWIRNEVCCAAQGTIFSLLGETMMGDNIRKGI